MFVHYNDHEDANKRRCLHRIAIARAWARENRYVKLDIPRASHGCFAVLWF